MKVYGVVSDGAAILDQEGRVWTVCRDGGMVVRPVLGNASNLETAGLAWLERTHGPLTILYDPGQS